MGCCSSSVAAEVKQTSSVSQTPLPKRRTQVAAAESARTVRTKQSPGYKSHVVVPEEILKGKRIFVVGDVHGCLDELQTLLRSSSVLNQDTILVSVGDLVNKGPKNAETLRYFRSLASSSLTVNEGDNKANTVEPRPFRVFHVRGNHEEALINTDRNKWTEELTEDEMQYLADLPYTLSFPSIGALVVHAGFVPGVKLGKQVNNNMTNMRVVAKTKGGKYEPASEGEPWASQWQGAEHIFFGHDARRKLQLYPKATGLDTGCLYGFELTGVYMDEVMSQPLHPKTYTVSAFRTYKQPSGDAKSKGDNKASPRSASPRSADKHDRHVVHNDFQMWKESQASYIDLDDLDDLEDI